MANLCEYKVKVRGRRNACYAFFGSMSCADGKWIVSESGTAEEFVLIFEGSCKWSVDCYCKEWEGEMPVTIPENADDAMSEAEDNYWYYTVQQRSQMFNVEVWCNSGDTEDLGCFEEMASEFDIPLEGLDLSVMCYEHYINGRKIEDVCPDELHFNLSLDDYDEYNDEGDEDFEEFDEE